MEDQFYDWRYEQAKRDERERTERALSRLEKRYRDEEMVEARVSGPLSYSANELIRYVARERALRKLEELGGGF